MEIDELLYIPVNILFVIIDLLNNLKDFGWGHNASVDGLYYKTKSVPNVKSDFTK